MDYEYYEDMRIECYECHTVINFHEEDVIRGYYIICPRCGEKDTCEVLYVVKPLINIKADESICSWLDPNND